MRARPFVAQHDSGEGDPHDAVMSGARALEVRLGRTPPARVLAVAAFGAFLAFLDATVVNVAFPNIRESFPHSSVSALSWVLNAYNIVFASFLIVCGRLTDLLGRRRMFALGTIVFTLSSVACAAAGSLDLLVLFRVVQAIGAALLVPASLAVVVEAFPEDRRSHAVGLWGASAALAAGLGPPIGGALVELGGWRLAFLVNLPIGVLAVVGIRRTLVESRAPGRRRLPDVRGAALLAAGLTSLTLAIVQGNDWGWSSVRVLAGFVVGAVLLAGFLLSSRAHPQPLLDPALLGIRSFSVGNVLTVVAGMGFYAYLLTNILWLKYVWGYSIFDAGLALVPGALVAAVVAGLLGDVAQKIGYRYVVIPGALVWAAAYLWYARIVDPTPAFLTQWLPGQVLSGLGVGATLPILGSAALAAVPGGRFATASAVVSSARQLGGALGIAILVVIIGTPTPANTVDVLRNGWIFCAACFAVTAVGAVLLRDRGSGQATEAERPRLIDVHVPAQRAGEDALAETLLPARHAAGETFFDRLPDAVRLQIEAHGTRVHLAAGEVLFRRGDDADAMFLVQSGRLEVLVDDVAVRELGPGAELGELALLTGGRRTAGVRARRDSVLLSLSRAQFMATLAGSSTAALAVATALAETLATARPPEPTGGGPARVIGVVGVRYGDPVGAVGHALADRLARYHDVLVSGGLTPHELAAAEQVHDRVVLVADGDDDEWRRSCLRQSDRVVVVADASRPAPTTWDGPAQTDLVLVGEPGAAALRAWSEVMRPWQIVTTRAPAYEMGGLVAALAGRSLGLVLAGGGARAMAHVGVIRELEEAGFEVHRVAGTSLGSVVAAVHALGVDGATLEQVHHDAFVRGNPIGDYTFPSRALTKGRRTPEFLRHYLGTDTLIEALPRQFRCVSVDLTARDLVVHRSGLLWEATAASARLPILTPPLRVEDRLLIDGCVLDNLPVGTLLERDEGPLVAVNIGSGDRAPSASGPRMPGLGETLLRLMTIGGQGTAQRARERGAYVITPPSLGVGMMEFHQLDRMVEAGRMAARALLDATGGDLFSSPELLEGADSRDVVATHLQDAGQP
jgi:EmrB/QacA subfamily drug resistance transporter